MVQGISSLLSRSGAISQVAKREEPRAPSNQSGVQADRRASFEELRQVSVENRTAAAARIEDLDAALQNASDIEESIFNDRGNAISAHTLSPERVARLLED